VAAAAAASGVKTLIHMSNLGADPKAESASARSRAAGDAAVFAAFPEAIVIRPSILFGPGDGFFNLLGTLARVSPILPLIGGNSKFQPVYVKDVAQAFVAAVNGAVKTGRIYELGGPDVETYKALTQRVLRDTGRSNALLPLSPGLAKLLAAPMGLLPTPLLTGDQVVQLQSDSVVSDEAVREKRTLAAFGVTPTPMEAVLPSYLWRFRKNGQFDRQTA